MVTGMKFLKTTWGLTSLTTVTLNIDEKDK